MGKSLVLCWGFWILLGWGCETTVCSVDDKSTVQPVTSTAYLSTTPGIANHTNGQMMPFACGSKSHICPEYCSTCYYFAGPTIHCISILLHNECLKIFEDEMVSRNRDDWCNWGNVSGLYSNLSLCTEKVFDCLLIPWPNPFVEAIFVDIHTKFFRDCPTEELNDPPPAIVFALVITPICLIPVMVSLVVLKTKNGDGSS
ncbi:receptor activity-modifying protein 2 isoform X1 [Takifugu rubripes]|nr:receptor activity-modifying protein 2 isoform X1 [Takifugu rubripes]|eukprot:XP_003964838.1 PREDICTED: receptor activity-modifying protein 2 isoform X1 [Takifugu rubripes]